MTEPLARLMVALEARRPVPDDLARWLLAGIERFRRGEADLAWCLGLEPMSWAERTRRRNAALRAAADCLVLAELGDWKRAGRLAVAVYRFEVEGIDCDCGHLATAAGYGDLPRSQRQLWDIIRRY